MVQAVRNPFQIASSWWDNCFPTMNACRQRIEDCGHALQYLARRIQFLIIYAIMAITCPCLLIDFCREIYYSAIHPLVNYLTHDHPPRVPPFRGFALSENHYVVSDIISQIPEADPTIPVSDLQKYIFAFADQTVRASLWTHIDRNTSNVSLQNLCRHFIFYCKEHDELIHCLNPNTPGQLAIINSLKNFMNRLTSTMNHCSNNLTSELESIYLQVICQDPSFIERYIGNQNFLKLLRLALMDYRNTLFERGCSIQGDNESAGTHAHTRRHIGSYYGILTPLTEEEFEFSFTANQSAISNVIETFQTDYTIPHIVKEMKMRMLNKNETTIPHQVVDAYLSGHYPKFDKNLLINVETGEWSDEALLLLLEDAGLIVYQGSATDDERASLEQRLQLLREPLDELS